MVIVFAISLIFASACKNQHNMATDNNSTRILFLHHSTGKAIWEGKSSGTGWLSGIFGHHEAVPEWFKNHNEANGSNYSITEQIFPKARPYGWNNYPFDYYNIWVKNGGNKPYLEEPTLEMLTGEYKMIIFKHCFPVGNIVESHDSADINSPEKTLENYKLQYQALKEKLHQFPDTRFLLWTAPALVESQTTPEEAKRTREFVNWVINDWDTEGDNIYLWDFYNLETGGGAFLKPENAVSADDSHPNAAFAARVAPLFCQRIIDVLETNGQKTGLSGEPD